MPEKTNTAAQRKGGSESYGAKDITVLEGLEAVRKRPGMYIGSTGPRGLHHLVYEVLDNSVDEAIAGYCDSVRVVLHPDNSCTVVDNGRGIPVDELKKEKRPAAEVVLTTLHAGGKFGGEGYKVSGGLHGVGISVVNALSEKLHLEISRDGAIWTQDYERGKPQADLHRGATSDSHGTTITFLPDAEIFDELEFDYATLARAPARDRLPHPRPQDRAGRRACRGTEGHLPLRGRHRRLRRPPQREQGPAAPQDGLLRERDRGRPGRGGDAVELLLPGIDLQLRQQHQHPRGRLPPLRLPLCAYPHAQRLRARQRPAQRERREPHRRRRARGADRGDLGQARRPAVRGSDQDQARQPADRGPGQGVGQPQARRVLRGEPGRGETDRRQGGRRRPRPSGRPQGARPDPPQVGAGELDPAGQARRLHRARPRACRAVHSRG